MLKAYKIFIFLVLANALCIPGFSQKREIEMGQAEFNDLQFNSAAGYFQKALLKAPENSNDSYFATFMLAESYRKMNDPDQAEPLYRQLTGTSFCDTVPIVYLRYADILRMKGDVSGAKENYQKYLQKDPANQEAKNGLQSCEWITTGNKKQAQINIKPLDNVNSKEDDFAPAFLSADFSQIIFSSNRKGENVKFTDQWTGSGFSDLLISQKSENDWGSAEPFDKLGFINSDVHEGTPSLNGDHDVIYFTRCDLMTDKKMYCQLWSTRKLESRWNSPRLVLSDTTGNSGQPSVSSDDLTLFFSSDRKGTMGGKDIWIVKRESPEQKFGTPENIGNSINTAGDEVFPYLFNDTTLFFSSNGHQGYGGWDIYMSVLRNGAWTAPMNLPAPYNSGYDDFGIIIVKPGEEGYFTSNRPGGKGGDDLYQFTRKTYLFTLSGKVSNLVTGEPVKDARVLMTGDDGSIAETMTDRQGNYKFDDAQVLEDHLYELTFKKDNYFATKENINTWLYDDNKEIIVNATIEPIPESPIVLPDILYELDKWDLLPRYQDSLTNLVSLLKDNEGIVIELRSHTDSRGSDEYNEVLSQKRAQTVVDFIISQGIDPRRLVAKGYGEKVFRVLDKDLVRENYPFKAGTELSDTFVSSLPSQEIKEAAYQLNRRTEFSVLSKDFKP